MYQAVAAVSADMQLDSCLIARMLCTVNVPITTKVELCWFTYHSYARKHTGLRQSQMDVTTWQPFCAQHGLTLPQNNLLDLSQAGLTKQNPTQEKTVMCLAEVQKVSSCTRHEAATAAADLCLLTPLNWEEQVASPVEVRTRRRRLVLPLEPVTGRRAHDIASVSLPLSAASASSPTLAVAQTCKA